MKLLQGAGVAIITPFNQKQQVDFDALAAMVEYMIEGGINYIVTLGTTGETPVLSREEKIEIIQFTYQRVKDRVPEVVGMSGNDTYSLAKELETYPLQGATAILSACPYYNKPSQQGLFEHYKLIASVSPKPVVLYNVPGRTGRNIDASTTLKLSREVENIIGIKEASGDFLQCMEILRDRPKDFLVVSGDDALALPQMACGMDGVISVAANAFPKEFSELIRMCLNQDFSAAKKINDVLMPAYQLMFEENNPSGVKAFLSELGLIKNQVRLPLVPLSQPLHQLVAEYVKLYQKKQQPILY
jgi:4-hydroxy-tetrahydrodipicolinate synthase